MSACPRCGGVLELVADQPLAYGERIVPFYSCSACEFCEEVKPPKLPAAPLPAFPSEGLSVVKVTRIDPLNTANPKVTDYSITCETLAAPARMVTYSTIHEKYATVCAWCLDQGRPAIIGWKRTRWGLKIVSAERAAQR